MVFYKNSNNQRTVKKIAVNTKLDIFIKNVNLEKIYKYSNNLLDEKLTKFAQKYKSVEHFLDVIVIKLVVDHENKAVEDFNSRHIIFYYDIENVILLHKILVMYSHYKNKEISLYFIIDDEVNKEYNYIEDYVIKLAKYQSNKHDNHEVFENSFSKPPSHFVKNARKSVINSLFSTNPKKVFRISNSNKLIHIDEIKDTLKNKYINLQCPICKRVSENSKKFEITENSINDIINIERNTNRISFNCLHEELEIERTKFFFIPKNYNVNICEHTNESLQIWTVKNFNFLVREELNEFNYSI